MNSLDGTCSWAEESGQPLYIWCILRCIVGVYLVWRYWGIVWIVRCKKWKREGEVTLTPCQLRLSLRQPIRSANWF